VLIGAQQDHPQGVIERAEHQHLGHEGSDLARWEIDDGHQQRVE
jgi:hypothetical protein